MPHIYQNLRATIFDDHDWHFGDCPPLPTLIAWYRNNHVDLTLGEHLLTCPVCRRDWRLFQKERAPERPEDRGAGCFHPLELQMRGPLSRFSAHRVVQPHPELVPGSLRHLHHPAPGGRSWERRNRVLVVALENGGALCNLLLPSNQAVPGDLPIACEVMAVAAARIIQWLPASALSAEFGRVDAKTVRAARLASSEHEWTEQQEAWRNRQSGEFERIAARFRAKAGSNA